MRNCWKRINGLLLLIPFVFVLCSCGQTNESSFENSGKIDDEVAEVPPSLFIQRGEEETAGISMISYQWNIRENGDESNLTEELKDSIFYLKQGLPPEDEKLWLGDPCEVQFSFVNGENIWLPDRIRVNQYPLEYWRAEVGSFPECETFWIGSSKGESEQAAVFEDFSQIPLEPGMYYVVYAEWDRPEENAASADFSYGKATYQFWTADEETEKEPFNWDLPVLRLEVEDREYILNPPVYEWLSYDPEHDTLHAVPTACGFSPIDYTAGAGLPSKLKIEAEEKTEIQLRWFVGEEEILSIPDSLQIKRYKTDFWYDETMTEYEEEVIFSEGMIFDDGPSVEKEDLTWEIEPGYLYEVYVRWLRPADRTQTYRYGRLTFYFWVENDSQ